MTFGTMEVIQTVTVGSGGTANITFSNIPQTYNDLLIKLSIRCSDNIDFGTITFNGSSSNFSSRRIQGDGSSPSSGTRSDNVIVAVFTPFGYTTSSFSSTEIYVPNYIGNTNKSFSIDAVLETNATSAQMNMAAGLWSNTAAITSVAVAPNSGTFVQHSTATLYGITRVPAGAKATGGVIYDDASYWYHVFTSSGTFTPSQNLTCDYLVVAGGGGGGRYYGGGGGAGGYRTTVGTSGRNSSAETPLSLIANTSYTVTIGAGGTAGANQAAGGDGGNSTFSTVTSTGGGGGGYGAGVAVGGRTGGAGGGAGGQGTASGGAGTASQGFDGGSKTGGSGGLGGGGAGAAGTNSNLDGGTSGGNGLASNIDNVTRAGGGGGSPSAIGGSGGGGTGATETVAATSGTVNTGSGGGGGSNPQVAGAGGSGIVIVRYAK